MQTVKKRKYVQGKIKDDRHIRKKHAINDNLLVNMHMENTPVKISYIFFFRVCR